MMQKIFLKTIGAVLNLLYFIAPKTAIELSIKIFSTPRRTPLREKELEFLKTARQERRSVADLPIVEYHWGEAGAPLAILAYGWEYNAGRWRHFVPALVEQGFRVIAYDPPGHGLAPGGQMNVPRNALIIKDLIEKYGKAEVIIGHSFGGGSSVYALSELPEWKHPKRLVVMAAFSFVPSIFKEFATAFGAWKGLYYGVVREFERRLGRRLEELDFARMTSHFSHVEGFLVHSPGDTVTPFAEARRFFDFWQGAALYAPAKGGHHLGTAETTAVIIAFAAKGDLPKSAEIQAFAMAGEHDMARYFSGV